MKHLLFFLLLHCTTIVFAQSFYGNWKGTLTRDYGNQTVTDSIYLQLVQEGSTITGYSVIKFKPGEFIRSRLEGSVYTGSKTIRLTEVEITNTNFTSNENDFFLDRYLLAYNDSNLLLLTGKSVPYDRRSIYSKSKVQLNKMEDPLLDSDLVPK